jgi:Sulfotransferase family
MTIDEYLDGRELARFPFAFIVTYGRSGSTLLQGILNAIDGYCIRGENDSTLFHLFCAVDAVARTRAVHTRLTATMPIDPWFGANDLDEATLSARLSSAFLEACLRPPERCRCIGFKEIRYLRPDIPDEFFEPYLRFLQSAFPGAAIIFNIRDPAQCSKSGWWVEKLPEDVIEEINLGIGRFERYAAEHPDCFTFSYDELMKDVGYSERLFSFLGEPFSAERVSAVVAIKHSYKDGVVG